MEACLYFPHVANRLSDSFSDSQSFLVFFYPSENKILQPKKRENERNLCVCCTAATKPISRLTRSTLKVWISSWILHPRVVGATKRTYAAERRRRVFYRNLLLLS